MYGGYDGSASQFAGQGGFMPTPAGATGTSPGAAAGAVSKCVRTSSVLSTNFSTSSQFKSRSSLARTPSLRFYLPPSLFTYVASTSPLENDCGGGIRVEIAAAA